MGAQPAELALGVASAYDHQSGVFAERSFANYLVDGAARQGHFQVDVCLPAQHIKLLPRLPEQVPANFYFSAIIGSLVRGRDGMNHGQGGIEKRLELERPAHDRCEALAGIDRAEDAPKIGRDVQGLIFAMNSGENRTIRVVQNLGRHRSQKEPAEAAMGVGRHQDEINGQFT